MFHAPMFHTPMFHTSQSPTVANWRDETPRIQSRTGRAYRGDCVAGSSGCGTGCVGQHHRCRRRKGGSFHRAGQAHGCTVLLFEKGATAGVDVRGGSPGTRDTELLNPVNTVQQVQGLLSSGGSAFGLEAASGVMRFLEEHRLGYAVGDVVVPIVPGAILFDLDHRRFRRSGRRPSRDIRPARRPLKERVVEGNVGAGAGATIGKMFGMKQAMKSGLGTASLRVGNTGIVVAAIVAVNAVGDVIDPKTGKIIAGARKPDGSGFLDSMPQWREGQRGLYRRVPTPPSA